MLLFSEGQEDKAWDHSNKAVLFQILVGNGRKTTSVFLGKSHVSVGLHIVEGFVMLHSLNPHYFGHCPFLGVFLNIGMS
jgi:hypothetical protein